MKIKLLLPLLLVGAVVAACGGSETEAPDTTNTPAASSETGAGDAGQYGAPEIAALLPTSVDGVAFEVTTVDYSKIPLAQAAMSFSGGDIEGWLGQKGKTWADVRWGMAQTDISGEKTATVTALRINGADEAAMLEWFGMSGMSMGDAESTATIGGKSVYKLEVPGLTMGFYYWASGDTLYYVTADPVTFGDLVVAATK